MDEIWIPDAGRAVLRLSGPEALEFLQDLVTNDLRRLGADDLVYAAILTPQGKYLFDFFVGAEGEALWIDVAEARAAALAQRLSIYRLRRKVEIAPTALRVGLWTGAERPEGARRDARAEGLGWRVYGSPPAAPASAPPADPAAYAALRVRLAVPETGLELVPDETYILEAGFERLNGVDFRKGCYVGQEVTARMKHKTELRKGLVRVAVEGEAAPGTPVETEGRSAGTLFTVAGGAGLAHLRFDRAEGEMRAGTARLRLLEIPA